MAEKDFAKKWFSKGIDFHHDHIEGSESVFNWEEKFEKLWEEEKDE